MLSARNLYYRVGNRVLIDNVSATFQPGLLHLIMGPNGAGKSTLVNVLARMLRPHAGQVTYGGTDAARWSDAEMARCRAVLSQAIEVAFPIPVREFVMMGRYPHFRGRPGVSDERICDEVMSHFEVTEFADRSYSTLSGGEKQRVNFARVLAQIWEPVPGSARYLFLDEPLTFLDIRHQIDFMHKVRRFASQADVVVVGVVHDLNLIARFADHMLLLHQGRLIADGGQAEVLTVEHLQVAFQVTPVFLTNSRTGEVHLTFD